MLLTACPDRLVLGAGGIMRGVSFDISEVQKAAPHLALASPDKLEHRAPGLVSAYFSYK